MAITTKTSRTELKSSFIRMDAEFFRPENVLAYKTLESIDGRYRLGQLCEKITQGSNPVFSKSGFPCVNGKNVYFGTMQEGEPNYVSEEEFNRLSNYCLRKNDIVITLKHATKIGRAWIVENENPPMIFARNVGLIRLAKESTIIPSVLLMYLWTKFGQLCLDRCATGGTSGQITLPMSELKRIPIPPFSEKSQREIDVLYQESIKSALVSEESYLKAKRILETELGLDKFKIKKKVGYTSRYSDIEKSRRIDPEHYYTAFQQLIDSLPGSIDLVPLGPQLHFCQRGRQPAYDQKGLPVINSKHVHSNKIVFEDNRTASLNHDSELLIRYDDVLVNGTGRGTLGRAAPFLIKEPAIPDNHITILRSSNLDPAYLSFYLNSQAGQLQVEMHQRGSSGQLELYPFDIRKFLVWGAPESLQKEIRKLYDQAIENERRSKKLITQAKHRVEDLIEQAVEGSGEKP